MCCLLVVVSFLLLTLAGGLDAVFSFVDCCVFVVVC